MHVGGIDLSLTSTGVCVLRNGELEVIKRLNTKDLRGVERLMWIEHKLFEVLPNHLDLICLEGYSFGSQGRAVFNIGELGGVIRRGLHIYEMPWLEIAPHSLKKFVTGKGNTKKEDMKLHIYKRWGVEFGSSDECDAYGLARMAEVIATGDTVGLTQAQLEAVAKPTAEYIDMKKFLHDCSVLHTGGDLVG